MTSRIRRREFLAGVGASLLLPACGRETFDPASLESIDSGLPFPVYSTHGRHALEAWEHLSAELSGSASPVVIGDARELENVIGMMEFDAQRAEAEILELAAQLEFPAGYREIQRREYEHLMDQYRNDPDMAQFVTEYEEPSTMPLGEWPSAASLYSSPGLSVARNVLTDQPFDEVMIAAVPTTDPTEIPAFLRFGGWNENPPPEWHVAALRHWRDQYGAQLVGLSSDVMNVRVSSRPENREAAIDLAFVQFEYCSDIVTQGFGNIAPLAAHLMNDDWWYFWWD